MAKAKNKPDVKPELAHRTNVAAAKVTIMSAIYDFAPEVPGDRDMTSDDWLEVIEEVASELKSIR